MIWETFEFWKVVLDLIGLCLCGTVIIYLVRNKKAYRQSLLARKPEAGPEAPESFRQVMSRSLEDGRESDFQTVSEAMEKDDPYRKAARMARDGSGMDEIIEKTDLPKSEVELVIKVNRRTPGN